MSGRKIAYIAYYDLNNHTAATEHISQIVNGLAGKGYRMWLFASGFGNRIFHQNIHTVLVKAKNALSFDSNVVSEIDRLNIDFDVLYIRDYFAARKIVDWSRCGEIPIIIEHNGLVHAEIRHSKKLGTRILFAMDNSRLLSKRIKKASMNIVVANAIAKFLTKKYGIPSEKFIHIPNGVDIERFCPAEDKESVRQRLNITPADAIWIGYIGSMYPWHILDTVVKSFEIIAQDYNNVFLLIGGDGPELATVKKSIQRSRYVERMKLISPLPIQKSNMYISSLDIGLALMSPDVAPYCWQVKVNHYAACGIPSVITHCDDFAELKKNGVAIGVKDISPSGIADEIKKTIDDDNFSLRSKNIRKYVVENLSWDIIINKTDRILQQIIGGKNGQDRVCEW